MTTHISLTALHVLMQTMFHRSGLSVQDAATAADVVCYADEHGFSTHGVNQAVSNYLPGLRDGRFDAGAVPKVVHQFGAVSVLDGGSGVGVVTMTAAVDLVAQAAVQFGIGAVAVRNSSHFGSAGYYTHRLVSSGLIGIAMTNCGRQGVVPPLGGAVRMLGTNPIAAGFPTAGIAPFMLDMSTTATATGRVKAAVAQGRPVPDGWLIDRLTGANVTDPQTYLDGTADVAWLGGHLSSGGAKGFGLGLLVDLICGPLAGASFGPRPEVLTASEPAPDRDIGHFVIALDPAAFGDPAQIRAQSTTLLRTVAACPPAGYASSVSYPGAPEAARAAVTADEGVVLTPAIIRALRRLAVELEIELPENLA